MKIQEYLTCAIQNIQTLIKHGSRPKKAAVARVKASQMAPEAAKTAFMSNIKTVLRPLNVNFGLNFGLLFQRA